MGGAVAGKLAASLGKHGGMQTVCVCDAADFGKFTVEDEVGLRVRRRPQRALYHLALQVENDNVGGLEFQVIDAAWFDGPEAGGAVNAAHIAPGQANEAAGFKGSVSCTHLFAEILEGHCGGMKAQTSYNSSNIKWLVER